MYPGINGKTHGDKKLTNLNQIEELADDICKILAICGMKYYSELKGTFDEWYNTLDILFYNSNRFKFYGTNTFAGVLLPCR